MCKLRCCSRPTLARGLCEPDYRRAIRRAPAATESTWELPSDGIVDSIAIDAAVSGSRRVRLCPTERLVAACMIIRAGGSIDDLQSHLSISRNAAVVLARTVLRLSCDFSGIDIDPALLPGIG
jgi:hypothetical protein